MKTKTMKAKKRFGPSKKGILVKGKWKAVGLDPSIFANEAMGEVVCFEELTDYSLVDSEKTAAMTGLLQDTAARKKRKNKRKASEIEAEEHNLEEDPDEVVQLSSEESPAKKRKKKKKKHESDDVLSGDDHDGIKNLVEEGEDQTLQDSDDYTEFAAETTQKTKKKKKKKKKKQKSAEQTETDAQVDPANEVQVPSKRKAKNWADAALSKTAGQDTDVSAWKELFVPEPVLKALSKLGFSAPTPIQALALPPAIRDHLDILGAAETGSGKTLSFGIPMIHSILEWKKTIDSKDAGADGKSDAVAEVESIYLPSVRDSKDDSEKDLSTKKSTKSGEAEGQQSNKTGGDLTDNAATSTDKASSAQSDDTDDEHEEENPTEDDGSLDGQDEDEDCGSVDEHQSQDDDGVAGDEEGAFQSMSVNIKREEKDDDGKQPLLGLVLTPTRELAVQVKHHIDAVAQFTGIRTALLVGGMAPQKQDRMLKRRPEIVIATPGRLWEMIQDKHPHLRNLRQLRCLVIDEADRMVEKGHFVELENLLEMLNTSQFNPKRQTFVFSATLTMIHSLPARVLRKKGKKLEQRSKLEVLMEKVGIKGKPKVIDLTRKEATVETLTETRIHCDKEEKDYYLYYFVLQYPGRTMVFANSIDCIKRLNSLLTILDCTPLPLHANMHQKQRLKNLERFAERESCVLLTTDVAARGLDIPNVQHVIHYQVPRTSETYVHRSGRTARAAKEGLSLLLIGPDDLMNYKKIYRTLGKDEDLPMFPVQNKCMTAIKERVDVARQIEKIEYYNSRKKQHNSWFRQAAEEMDIDLDDDLLLGGGREEENEREQQKHVKGLKKHLKHLLSQPVFKAHMKTKYPTQMGKLQLPELPLANETALISVTNQKQKQKQKKRKGKQQQM
ncbi:ATP-dependent RNA helicase DDX24 [Pangasianodon hypophthalmus]|uniref:ATP-dependent RNA helicase DDX24 n=1 Tax=Pangasianodon hypophthalmus TaxID=310915 RepID=UPI002307DEF5|nr:ATP-dependent RNA helicase DDX24 [Pangasianodon hypophthalmus]XP_053093370.1 ATP-dependent RNA helicase DDX24 [Pangasianodon hypophthalmus]XP_053093371.1 ATP-dependent RNA helicase DDX24 [Pangasianodon hypophthalmus]XP_053093372.1 ATP-dependent RNA helicase DDX24 [Pangasianodon hypophthalmus]